jgi:hypothetical protein
VDRPRAIDAQRDKPDTRVLWVRIVRSGNRRWSRHTTYCTRYVGSGGRDTALDGVSPSTCLPESFIRLSGGATTQQISSAGVPETFRGSLVFVRNHVWPGLIRKIGRYLARKNDMYTEQCPLCYAFTRNGAIAHLERDHRRSYAEACVLVERSKKGTLGRNAQNGRQKVLSSLASAKVAPPCANPITSRPLWLPVPWPFGNFGFW